MAGTGGSWKDGLPRGVRLAGLLVLGIALGVVAGNSALAVTPAHADDDEFCEQDECVGRRPWWNWFRRIEQCADNAPHNTGCNMTGKDVCYTYGCGGPTPPTGSGGGGGGDGDGEM